MQAIEEIQACDRLLKNMVDPELAQMLRKRRKKLHQQIGEDGFVGFEKLLDGQLVYVVNYLLRFSINLKVSTVASAFVRAELPMVTFGDYTIARTELPTLKASGISNRYQYHLYRRISVDG